MHPKYIIHCIIIRFLEAAASILRARTLSRKVKTGVTVLALPIIRRPSEESYSMTSPAPAAAANSSTSHME